MRRAAPILLIFLALLAGGAVGLAAATLAPRSGSPSASPVVVAGGTPPPTVAPASPSPTPEPTPTPSPTPVPTPTLVPAPLDGFMVTEPVAQQHPIAVMIDDHPRARPQSGFNAASVIWQAPAEGGVTLYADKVPVHRAKPGRSGARRAVQIAGPARGGS